MRRHVESLSDWLAVALSPTLIVFLLASLVCFLVEILYQGDYSARLQFVFCMFVMASVCVARISMEEGSAYAAVFAAPLAAVTALALSAFVQYTGPLASVATLVNFALMGGIWYCSHQLTKDSTLPESGPDETGAGLLTQLGWDREGTTPPEEPPPEAVTEDRETKPQPTWFEKFVRGDGPHSPGAWAFYFSLAALPVFGVGQFFLPTDLASRRWVFRLLVIYITAALGLLLATSFLGLRRYLHQRKLDLPLDMAAAWLAVGTTMIFGLLGVAFLLPRPLPEYSMVHWLPEIKSAPREQSPVSVGEEGTKKGEPGRGKGESEKKDAGGQGKGKGKSEEKSKEGEPGKDGEGSKSGGEKSSDKGEQKSGDQKGEEQKGNDSKSPQQSGQEQENSPPGPPKTGKESQPKSSEQVKSTPPPAHQSSGPSILQRLSQALPDIFNYLGFAIIFAVIAYFAYHNREFLRAAWQKLLQELAELWERLFGRRPQPETVPASAAAPPPLPPAFASFSDPFATGQAAKWSLAELVRYSFKALEAWGRERGSVRTEEQTPGEYAQSVATAQPAVAVEVQQLAALYGQVAYGPGAASQPAAEIVRRFWRRLLQPTA